MAFKELNLIAPKSIPTWELRILAAEYSNSPVMIRRLLQTLFVNITTSSTLRQIAASFYISVKPWVPFLNNVCILPGNHSLRIVDISQGHCIVLGKAGFSQNSIQNEIKIRSEHQYLPVPELLEFDIENNWYREQRITGLPVNRVKASSQSSETIIAAKKAMLQLYEATSELEPISKWVSDKIAHIERKVTALPGIYDSELRSKILGYAQHLATGLMREKSGNENIATALTHGDFQSANILIPKSESPKSVYLIDWEYAERRCRWYDALVLDLDSRFPEELGVRVCEWLSNSEAQARTLDWCCTNLLLELSSLDLMRAFLLEEIDFRLDDCMVPGQMQAGTGLMSFHDQIHSLRSSDL